MKFAASAHQDHVVALAASQHWYGADGESIGLESIDDGEWDVHPRDRFASDASMNARVHSTGCARQR